MMKTKSRYSWWQICLITCFGWFIGITGTFYTSENGGIPDRSDLIKTEGLITGIQKTKYSIYFTLTNSPCQFRYSSKSGGMGIVSKALEAADQKLIILEHGINCDVWVVSVGENTIRNFSEISTMWRNDNKFGFWLGLSMLGLSCYLSYYAWTEFKNR
jgi:hypothetical protein